MKNIIVGIFILLITFLHANATDIIFSGTWHYQIDYSQSTVHITGDKIENNATDGNSGTIKIQLFLTSTIYTGGSITGYVLAESIFAPLSGGYYYHDIDKTVNFNATPPDGYYYLTLTLSEYTDEGYIIQSYINFSEQIAFESPHESKAERILNALSTGLNAANNTMNAINSINSTSPNNTLRPTTTTDCRSYQQQYETQRGYAHKDIMRLTDLRSNDDSYGKYGEKYAIRPNPALNVSTLKSIRATQKLMRTLRELAQSNGCYIPTAGEENW